MFWAEQNQDNDTGYVGDKLLYWENNAYMY